MPQLYLFIGALLAVIVIVTRRSYVYLKSKKLKFKEEVAQKVDELHKERHHVQNERFKDAHLQEQKNKKYDFSQYKLILRKADIAMARQQWTEAKKCLIQSLAVSKDEINISLKLAKVYLESGDLKRAEMLYKRLLEVDKNNASIYTQLAKIYTTRKNYKEAVQAYVQAMEIDDKDDKSLIGLGRLYKLLMRHSLSAECFKRAAELKPREVEYLFLLAESCKEADDYENALFTYEKILTLEPYNERASNEAQDVRIKMNENEKIITA
jgi:tetratricopeptide (TPR) repeat protein